MRILMILIVLAVIAFLTLKQMGGSAGVDGAGSASDAPPVAVEDAAVELDSLQGGAADAGGADYTLQVAMEPTEAAAQRVAASMSGIGETARIVRAIDAEGTPWYIVMVGHYERIDQAQLAQAALMGKVGMQRPVTVIRSPG
jgi:septal ring-binding cell division protein DamX